MEVKGDSLLAKAKRLAGKIKDAVTGEDTDTGVFHDFVYEESGVEGAAFELYAKDTIYSPDGAKDEQGNPVIRYEKDDLVATLVTDTEGKAVVNNLPLGSYYLKETVAGDHFVLNPEQKEFTLTKVEMKDAYSKVEISKTDITTGKELEGAKPQILNKDGEVLEEWVTDGKPHLVEKLPVGEELILREITAPEGYEIAEDVKFTLEDTMEVQKVEMKDARTPETPGVPQTGDDQWKPILLFALLGVSAAGLMATMIYKKRHGKTEKADEAKKEE